MTIPSGTTATAGARSTMARTATAALTAVFTAGAAAWLLLPPSVRIGGLDGFDGARAVQADPGAAPMIPAGEPTKGPLEYNRDIRPILAENCFACHGPDSASRQANLRLDIRADALKAKAIVPGDTKSGGVLERIFSDDPDAVMPPPKSHKKLTPAQRDVLKRWIAAGAEYQPHWSFIPPERPKLPEVKDAAWAKVPFDRFVLAGLEKAGLTPAPEADRRTLARRIALDVTGLPPEPADVEAYVADKSADADVRFIDKMLASPHWGEHRARYWLDAARYGDTHGIHFDNYREMWVYRDWVIEAFNRNLTFDQFTIEQLAGDMLPSPTIDQRIASGFNRCNMTTNEGGIIDEEYAVLYTRDRTETTAAVWMGLTVNCAVCHDHKFDPVSQREFYSMSAFFNNTVQGARDGNIKDTPPVLVVPLPADRGKWDALSAELGKLRKDAADRKAKARPAFDAWAKTAKVEEVASARPTKDLHFHAPLAGPNGPSAQLHTGGTIKDLPLPDGVEWGSGQIAEKAYKSKDGKVVAWPEAGDLRLGKPFTYGAWIKLPKLPVTGAIFSRMDTKNNFRGWDLWFEGSKFGAHVVSAWPGDAVKVVAQKTLKANTWHHVLVTSDGTGKSAGFVLYLDGVKVGHTVTSDTLKGPIDTAVPFKLAQRSDDARINDLSIQDVRIYDRKLSADEVTLLVKTARIEALLAKPADKRTPKEKDELFEWWMPARDKPYQDLTARIAELSKDEDAIKGRGTVAHVMQEKPGEAKAFVLFRGEYDKRRDPVTPGVPAALPAFPADLPKNRLGFAQWLLRPDHPLTARVTVNRFWQEIFGNGIVRTAGDFGVTGDLPTHPELLDFLAVDFREGGWDVKKFFRMVLSSATYRQSAAVTAAKLEKDPANKLLSRGPRFRMDAEMIRDYGLAASGLLVRKLGGPSVRPYQPDGVWEAVAMIGSNTRNYKQDKGENLWRRSMYTFWKRAAPPASMEILNAPAREFVCVKRERTNTPLQALVSLNDIQLVEAARVLAQAAIKAGGTDDAKLDHVTMRVLARTLRPAERTVVLGVLADLRAEFKAKADDAGKLLAFGEAKADDTLDKVESAAWTMVVNQLLNLDEALNK